MSDIPFPFDLPGPLFLVFFIVFTAGLLLALRTLTNQAEDGEPVQIQASDPYRLAYLRGGAGEAIRLAVFALSERGFLNLAGKIVKAHNAGQFRTNLPLEQRVMQHFASPQPLDKVRKTELYDWTERHYRAEFQRSALVPDAALLRRRAARRLVAWILLLAVAGTKIAVAYATGHTNVGLLIVLTAVALWLVARVAQPQLTARGRRVMKDMRELFSGLRQRAGRIRPGSGTAEAVLLAAVFGFSALPAGFSSLSDLFSPHRGKDGGGCGSAGGCGGGGGGDGGGGGGGGGGCGGCGS